jgi:hypothetical protein
MLNLLWGVADLFFVLWLLGVAAFHVTSAPIHILPVLAVVIAIVQTAMG